MVSERGLDVLRVIVQDYVSSREPVGSKSIVERHSFGVSAATIRNDMAQLEEEELIVAPHTSSGRIPTDKGYRFFVNQLADRRPLSSAQKQAIEIFLGRASDLDELLGRTVRLLSSLTRQVALVEYPRLGGARIRHVELVPLGDRRLMTVLITDSGRVDQGMVELERDGAPEFLHGLRMQWNDALAGTPVEEAGTVLEDWFSSEAAPRRPEERAIAESIARVLQEHLDSGSGSRLVMAGAANLARTAEDFGGQIHPVLEAIEEQVTLLRLFAELELDSQGLSSSIGRENAAFGLSETSVVVSDYSAGASGHARLGVLGPTRMDYSANMAAVRAVARYLSRLLGDE